MNMIIEQLHRDLDGDLSRIARRFVRSAKLTLVVRIPGNDDADVVVTIDDLGEVVKAIMRRDPTVSVPTIEPVPMTPEGVEDPDRLDRAARACYAEFRLAQWGDLAAAAAWEEIDEWARDWYRRLARVAIEHGSLTDES